MTINEKVLVMCSWCESILVSDPEHDVWLRKKSNDELYRQISKKYDKISHGCCTECKPKISETYGLSLH